MRSRPHSGLKFPNSIPFPHSHQFLMEEEVERHRSGVTDQVGVHDGADGGGDDGDMVIAFEGLVASRRGHDCRQHRFVQV